MNSVQSLSHSVWDCKYHIVWIPKCRRKVLYGRIRQHLGEVIRELARQRESVVVEGHLCSDHVYVYISVPPNFWLHMSLVISKGKVQFTLPELSEAEHAIYRLEV